MKTIVTSSLACLRLGLLSGPQTRKQIGPTTARSVTGLMGRANTKMGKQLNAKDLTDPKVQAAFTDAKATQSIKKA